MVGGCIVEVKKGFEVKTPRCFEHVNPLIHYTERRYLSLTDSDKEGIKQNVKSNSTSGRQEIQLHPFARLTLTIWSSTPTLPDVWIIWLEMNCLTFSCLTEQITKIILKKWKIYNISLWYFCNKSPEFCYPVSWADGLTTKEVAVKSELSGILKEKTN